MCGRFTLTRFPDEWSALLELPPFSPQPPRYNIAPSQYILTILRDPESPRPMAQLLVWGLLPAWAKDKNAAQRAINARAETAAEKPTFRAALRHRRALIPVDGFYEWSGTGANRHPYYFQMWDGRPFAIAGLWEHWEGPAGEMIDSCALLTTVPNALIAPLHHRMPVILAPDQFRRWLDPNVQSGRDLTPMLTPFPAEAMRVTRVSRRVNSVAHDDPACIRAAEADPPPGPLS